MKPVEVICQHKMDGTIIPIKFKLIDDDVIPQAFVIKRYKDKTNYQTDANGIKVNNDFFYTFTIVFEILGQERYAELRYGKNSNLWDINV